MTETLDIRFAPLTAELDGTLALLCGPELSLGARTSELESRWGGSLLRAARAAGFSGKAKSAIEILAPPALECQRVLFAGAGELIKEIDRLNLGGFLFAQIAARKTSHARIIADVPTPDSSAAAALPSDLAFGALLRSYAFKKYVTRPADEGANGEAQERLDRLTILCSDPDAAAAAFAKKKAVAEGVFLARDLVNEPANVLGPVEFAERLRELAGAGLIVEVLDEHALKELKMNALLAVARGSARPGRVAVIEWRGADAKEGAPLCFVGKGVCFDAGGISIKPSQGMEDMKGDVGGAACVAGLMLALARRKAPVHAVALVGLVENMPSGAAQRPGDIVTSMSGQTIEVVNTDAEGRLVLADVLWYAQERFKPRFVIDLATLTGAIMVALGKEYAGLFCNDDRLAAELLAAGEATGERLWRMPLAKAYDRLLESKNADMKNVGGRHAGAITAAQFLQRFIKDTAWAHVDIAGTAMDSPKSDINRSWGSGWGVRLLDRLVIDNYEKQER
jgi:leucyl aminopeptidase